MSFLCAICKQPLDFMEIIAKLDGKYVHLRHHGVRGRVGAADITMGSALALKNPADIPLIRKRVSKPPT